MRWPLHYQMFLPFTVLLLGAVALVSGLEAYFSARHHRQQVQQQLQEIATTLAPGQFPLTDSVLRQTHQLSGAHFVVANSAGKILFASSEKLTAVPASFSTQLPQEVSLGPAVELAGSRYLHAAVKLRPQISGGSQQLHILYPEHTWRQAWRENVYPPLLAGGVVVLLAAVVSALIAAGVSRPITRLRKQVEQIARGNFRSISEPRRNDEILDLVKAVNQMAATLAGYEKQLRRDERLKALGQLQGSLAHQLRNAVTGCRMSIDLHHLRASPQERQSESLVVARRQLALIEKHLDTLLKFDEAAAPFALVNLQEIVREVIPLLQPAAEHAHVRLEFNEEASSLYVRGDRAGLEQVVINLLQNAIDAACQHDSSESPAVVISLLENEQVAQIKVSDNGAGPSAEVRDNLFDPLVTGKSHGTGLGLTASLEIVKKHAGRLTWRRENGWTEFLVELPRAEAAGAAQLEMLPAEVAGR